MYGNRHTLEMEQNILLIVLEHLGNEFNVHVLNVDFLMFAFMLVPPIKRTVLGCGDTCSILFITTTDSLSFSCNGIS